MKETRMTPTPHPPHPQQIWWQIWATPQHHIRFFVLYNYHKSISQIQKQHRMHITCNVFHAVNERDYRTVNVFKDKNAASKGNHVILSLNQLVTLRTCSVPTWEMKTGPQNDDAKLDASFQRRCVISRRPYWQFWRRNRTMTWNFEWTHHIQFCSTGWYIWSSTKSALNSI